MKVALTGASGLVGSRFFDLLKSKYEIIPISSTFGIDITDKKKIHKFLSNRKPSVIVHMAAKTHVDSCENDRKEDIFKTKKSKVVKGSELELDNLDENDWKDSNSAFGINVVGTKNVADYARENDTPMIYISTDFVFNGEKNGEYTEEDLPNPINWYGQTKLWGEKTLPQDALITRMSYPYGYKSQIKKDFVWGLADILLNQDIARLVSDQIITPTFIDDAVWGLDFLMGKNVRGLVNLVGNNFLSPYEIGIAISRELGLSEIKLDTTTREKLYAGRARRPFKVMLKNDKLRALGFQMTDFYDTLQVIMGRPHPQPSPLGRGK